MRTNGTTIVVVLFSIVFFFVGLAFTWNNSLASFADDSVSYLVMAQYFSPYHAVSPAIAGAYAGETNYPPIFPIVLAIFGGSHDFAIAHLVVVACLSATLLASYFYLRRAIESAVPALGAVLLFATMPVVWMNIQGILSEGLFLLLVLFFLLVYDRWQPVLKADLRRVIVLGVLLAVVVLTRNVGVALIGAYVITTFLGSEAGKRLRVRAYVPALMALAGMLAWVWLRPSGLDGLYTDIIRDIVGTAGSPDDVSTASEGLLFPQIFALYPAWASSFLLYWTDVWTAREAIVIGLAATAIPGLVIRLAGNRIDAWYVLLYFGIITLWPTSLQMQRFLFPIMPFLLLYILEALRFFVRRIAPKTRTEFPSMVVMAATMLVVTVPALAFFYHRSVDGRGSPYPYIAEYYRVPNLAEAQAKATLHVELFKDMQSIARTTGPDDTIVWYLPGYLALLADRKSVAMPPVTSPAEFFGYLGANQVDYIFLSRLHPRSTLDKTILTRWEGYFPEFTLPIWRRVNKAGETESVLLRVDREKLERLYRSAVDA